MPTAQYEASSSLGQSTYIDDDHRLCNILDPCATGNGREGAELCSLNFRRQGFMVLSG